MLDNVKLASSWRREGSKVENHSFTGFVAHQTGVKEILGEHHYIKTVLYLSMFESNYNVILKRGIIFGISIFRIRRTSDRRQRDPGKYWTSLYLSTFESNFESNYTLSKCYLKRGIIFRLSTCLTLYNF